MTHPSSRLHEAAERIRDFNHQSLRTSKDWEYPSHTDNALANLASLTQILAQAIEQSAIPALHAYEHGQVVVVGGDPDLAIQEMIQAKNKATALADQLTAEIRSMWSAAAQMGLDVSRLPEFADADD